MNLTREERETVCVYNEASDTWDIDSTVRKHITRLQKMIDDEYIESVDGRITGIRYKNAPAKNVRFRRVIKLSNEEKQRRRKTILSHLESKTM
ncbi:hypothetical protein [Staphylococcus hyicus]|uniref:hypothetical protein n=1 Tax=Staphylococcus hyicus TaxID=1284 RepID=UPI003132B5A4